MGEAAGTWKLIAHSQLDGQTATIPVEVKAAATELLQPINDLVIARQPERIRVILAAHTGPQAKEIVIPVFEGNMHDAHLAVAKQLETLLKGKGVKVAVWDRPPTNEYLLTYMPNEEQSRLNDAAMRGDAIGKLKGKFEGYMDFYGPVGASSGWVFGRDVILLERADEKLDNPLAEHLVSNGMLWPECNAAFPGAGRAVVQVARSAFAFGSDAIIVQATDSAGLERESRR